MMGWLYPVWVAQGWSSRGRAPAMSRDIGKNQVVRKKWFNLVPINPDESSSLQPGGPSSSYALGGAAYSILISLHHGHLKIRLFSILCEEYFGKWKVVIWWKRGGWCLLDFEQVHFKTDTLESGWPICGSTRWMPCLPVALIVARIWQVLQITLFKNVFSFAEVERWRSQMTAAERMSHLRNSRIEFPRSSVGEVESEQQDYILLPWHLRVGHTFAESIAQPVVSLGQQDHQAQGLGRGKGPVHDAGWSSWGYSVHYECHQGETDHYDRCLPIQAWSSTCSGWGKKHKEQVLLKGCDTPLLRTHLPALVYVFVFGKLVDW